MDEEITAPEAKREDKIMTENEAPVKVGRKPGRKPRSVEPGPKAVKAASARAKPIRRSKPKPEDMSEVKAFLGGRRGRAASAPVSVEAALDVLGRVLDCLRLLLGRSTA